MHLLAVGLNHNTAPVSLREQIAIGPDETVDALRDLVRRTGVAEAAILSTCNRTELYCHTDPKSVELPVAWLHEFRRVGDGQLQPHLYHHQHQDAVRHMLRVASGLDSMVLGEPEILGQMKDAYRLAREASSVNSVLDRLFQHTFSAAKQVRTRTAVGREPVSVAFAAVTMARRLFGQFRDKKVLVIGAGETIELVARHLFRDDRVDHLIVANRTLARAEELARRYQGTAIALSDIPNYLGKADLIFSSTGAPDTIVSREMMQAAVKQRKRKPVFVVDLAVPRDIDPAVGELEDFYLYTVDDLEGVVDAGMQARMEAAREADSVIELKTGQYMRWLQAQDAVGLIRSYRAVMDEIREELTERAQKEIDAGHAPAEVLDKFAHQLLQKVLHVPTANVRKAGEEGRRDVLDAAHEILGVARSDKDT